VLATLSVEYARGDYEARVWKLLAYLGRYGRQPLASALRLTMRECVTLAEQLGTLMEEEAEAHKRAAAPRR